MASGANATSNLIDETRAKPALTAAQTAKIAAFSVPFVPNVGQMPPETAFSARLFAGELQVTARGELRYRFSGKDQAASQLTERFIDANGQPIAAMARGGETSGTGISLFRTPENGGNVVIPTTFRQIDLGEVFQGVSVSLRATNRNVEKIFTVAPAQSPENIRLQVDGAKALRIDAAGRLIAETQAGEIAYTAPIAFQLNTANEREAVSVRYALLENDDSKKLSNWPEYAFSLGDYDQSRPLIIDPLLAATYLGGTGGDIARVVAVHQNGEIIVAGDGEAGSNALFPATTLNGYIFVARLNDSLTQLRHVAYLDGALDEFVNALAINPLNGDVYLGGFTKSSAGLPNMIGAAQPIHASPGANDGFIARFSADLQTLHRSTFFGTTGTDTVLAMAFDGTSNALYFTGRAGTTTGLPGFVNTDPYSTESTSNNQCRYIARLAADLSAAGLKTITLCTTGANELFTVSLVLDPARRALFVGGEFSGGTLEGVSAQSAQSSAVNTSFRGFLSKVDLSLASGRISTLFDGGDNDSVLALALHPRSGDVYATGLTNSTDLPNPVAVYGGAASAGQNVFLARFSNDLRTLRASAYLQGTGDELSGGIAISPLSGEVFIAGYSSVGAVLDYVPPSLGIPVNPLGACSSTHNFAFVARYSEALGMQDTTCLGGNSEKYFNHLAIHPSSGEVYAVGSTDETGAAPPTPYLPGTGGAAQATYMGGGYDGIVVRMTPDLRATASQNALAAFMPQSSVATGSVRTSNEVQMTGLPANSGGIYVSGAAGSQLCLTTAAGCCAALPAVPAHCAIPTYVSGWTPSLSYIGNNEYISVRHTNNGGHAETHLHIDGVKHSFRSSTGNAEIACNLDINGDSAIRMTQEALVFIRAALGLNDGQVANGTLAPVSGSPSSAWTNAKRILNANCGTGF